MNWKKILAWAAGGGVLGNVAAWGHEALAGHHIPFTAGTILVPALPGMVAALGALFTHRPQDK